MQLVQRLAPSEESWEMIGGSEVGDPGSHGQIILQIPCGVGWQAGGSPLVQVRSWLLGGPKFMTILIF